MRHRYLIGIAALSVALLGLAACTSGAQSDTSSTDDPPPLINPSQSDSEPQPATSATDLPQPATPTATPQSSETDVQPAPTSVGTPADPAFADDDAEATPPDPAATEAPEEPPPSEAPPLDGLLITPSQFPQPSSFITLDVIPRRPDDFADYGRAALPWLQGRITVENILPIFEAWRMPPVIGGFRLNLVDTNGDAAFPGDGRSAIAIVYTDPPTIDIATGFSNLVVYEPLLETPGAFRLVYDHDLVEQSLGGTSGRSGIAVTNVTDVNGDGLRDISFQELVCDTEDCRRISFVLSNVGGEDGNVADAYFRVTLP